MKVCCRCKIEKDESLFSKDKTRGDGLQATCKTCKKENYEIHRLEYREKDNAYHRAHYAANRETYLQNHRRFYQKHKDKLTGKRLKYLYGIDQKEYDKLREQQNYCCRICARHESDNPRLKKLVVDHCHITGIVRGLLCTPCNTAIGLLRDNSEILQKAINYLRSNNESAS